jgi:branched-chain amino acid transport system substrate-binding protein
MRGVTLGILWVEAIRTAQEKFGKGKTMTGEQVRWGLENLNVDAARQKALGAFGMFPTVKTSCDDHEGSGRRESPAVGRQEVGRDHAELGGRRQGADP